MLQVLFTTKDCSSLRVVSSNGNANRFSAFRSAQGTTTHACICFLDQQHPGNEEPRNFDRDRETFAGIPPLNKYRFFYVGMLAVSRWEVHMNSWAHCIHEAVEGS